MAALLSGLFSNQSVDWHVMVRGYFCAIGKRVRKRITNQAKVENSGVGVPHWIAFAMDGVEWLYL
jgi:hypothetical protein